MSTKAISKERFDALCRVKLPFAHYVSREIEWHSDSEERVLGVVLLDLQDNDWVWMVLGRDEAGLFRAVALDASIPTQEAARELLITKIEEHSSTGQSVFPQGDVDRDSLDLFKPVVSASSLHENYRILANGVHHSSAREMLRELARAFVDVDGNFLKDFQTTGFNARLWELYLSAFLYEQRFSVDRDVDRPDFCAAKAGFPVGIEAVTVNPTAGETPPKPTNDAELRALRQDYMPIKFGSVLFSKLQKRYWELPHMVGLPLVFAVHDFCFDDSMTWSAPAIEDYLYGLRATWRKDESGKLHIAENIVAEHCWNSKRIPSGFFNQPDTRHISAVLFSNAATLAKFNRMGKLAGFGDPSVHMIRMGAKQDFDPNATEPIRFSAEVEPGQYTETWTDGIRIFHNPNAFISIPPGVFTNCAHFFLEEGRRISMLPENFVHYSHTLLLTPKEPAPTPSVS